MRSVTAIAVILAGTIALHAYGETGTGDQQFVRCAVITVERCSGRCDHPDDRHFKTVELTEKQVGRLKDLIVSTIRRNHREELDAARHDRMPGGIPGYVTFLHRITFTKGAEHHEAWLHDGGNSAWIEGDDRIGFIVFNDAEVAVLNKLLP